jgi:small subunit ribosomal protein S10
MPSPVAKSVENPQKIRITLRSFEQKLIDDAAKKIIATAKDSGAIVIGPIPLPTKVERVTLNRSTFIDKNARDQFEIRRYKRLIDISDPTPKTLSLLQSINLPSGAGVEIKLF